MKKATAQIDTLERSCDPRRLFPFADDGTTKVRKYGYHPFSSQLSDGSATRHSQSQDDCTSNSLFPPVTLARFYVRFRRVRGWQRDTDGKVMLSIQNSSIYFPIGNYFSGLGVGGIVFTSGKGKTERRIGAAANDLPKNIVKGQNISIRQGVMGKR
jgi:hypothetical protein